MEGGKNKTSAEKTGGDVPDSDLKNPIRNVQKKT
jgi:hypothetical protein